MSLAAAAVLALSGLLVCWLAYRIGRRGDVGLVAGYEPGAAADEAAFARFVARQLLLVGVLTLDMAVVVVWFRSTDVFWLVYAVLVAAVAVRTSLRARRVAGEKSPT